MKIVLIIIGIIYLIGIITLGWCLYKAEPLEDDDLENYRN